MAPHGDAPCRPLLSRAVRGRGCAVGGAKIKDKIMVLEQGRLVEFGAPKELMARSGGRFRALVHAQPAE